MQGLSQSSLGMCSRLYGPERQDVLWPDIRGRVDLDAFVSQLASRNSGRTFNRYRRSLRDAFHGVSVSGDTFSSPHQLYPQLCDQCFIGLSPKWDMLPSQAQQGRATGRKEGGFQINLWLLFSGIFSFMWIQFKIWSMFLSCFDSMNLWLAFFRNCRLQCLPWGRAKPRMSRQRMRKTMTMWRKTKQGPMKIMTVHL